MRIFILTNLIIALCFSILADAVASEIFISHKVKSHQAQALKDDLKALQSFTFEHPFEEKTHQLLGLEKIDGPKLQEWLKERVKYIVDEKALKAWKIILGRNVFLARKSYEFENPDLMPIVESPNEENQANEKGIVVMANVGTMLYYMGKQNSQLMGIKVKRSTWRSYKVPASSPRSGILQIGEGLFSHKLLVNKKDPAAFSNSIMRLATLFHEARHSDGNGVSLGFFHALCPEGHDFAGVNACDRNANGPYAVGAQMVKEFSKNCKSCDESEKAALKILFLDSRNRILSEQNWDPRPEGKVLPRL